MKLRMGHSLLLFSLFVPAVLAQETPATQEEILKLFEAMQTRSLTQQIFLSIADRTRVQMAAVAKERFPAATDRFMTRVDMVVTEMLNSYPIDDIVKDMIPVYQKHFTSSDVSVMIAFYSSPTGRKALREMSAIVSESMQISQPRIQRHMEGFNQKLQRLIQEMGG